MHKGVICATKANPEAGSIHTTGRRMVSDLRITTRLSQQEDQEDKPIIYGLSPHTTQFYESQRLAFEVLIECDPFDSIYIPPSIRLS